MPRPAKKRFRLFRHFSTHWFFLVFWLTVIATVMISWSMIIGKGGVKF